jgi:hypothetical protein
MSYSRNIDSRYIGNTRMSSRTKQVLVLVATIIIGMLISATLNAIPQDDAKPATASIETAMTK